MIAIFIHLPMNDCHFSYKQKFPKKNNDLIYHLTMYYSEMRLVLFVGVMPLGKESGLLFTLVYSTFT